MKKAKPVYGCAVKGQGRDYKLTFLCSVQDHATPDLEKLKQEVFYSLRSGDLECLGREEICKGQLKFYKLTEIEVEWPADVPDVVVDEE